MAAVLALPLSVAVARDLDADIRQAEKVRSAEPARFSRLLDTLLSRSGQANPRQRRHLRLLRAYRNAVRGEYATAIREATLLHEQAPEAEIRFRAGLLIANTAALTRDFAVGLRFLERALALRDRVSDPEIRQQGMGVAAVLYNQFGQYTLGLHHAERLLASNPSDRNRCAAGQLRIEALRGLGRTVAPAEFAHALEDCKRAREPIAAGFIRSVQARQWRDAGQSKAAVALLERHLPDVERTGYSRLIAEYHALLARLRLEIGDVVAAEQHARRVSRLKGDPRWIPSIDAYHVLYEIAHRRGDYRVALTEYKRYAEAQKAYLDDVQAREYAFQLSQYEVRQKNQSIALLQQQNQLLRLQQEVARKSQWNTRLAFALLALLTLSAVLWGYRGRRTQRSLRQLADTDSLTGLSNRRHFRARSEAALAAAAQRARPVSMLLFDLDHFKQINDQCGHASGDWVLREVARVGRLHCRQADVFGRIGGEEFAMTLIDCDLDAAMRIAEECRRAIEAIDARAAGCALPVSASIGCVGTSRSGYDYETLVAHADAAMYRSKVGGRNRVTAYEPSADPDGCEMLRERRNAAAALASGSR